MVAAAIVLALLAPACGGDSNDDTPVADSCSSTAKSAGAPVPLSIAWTPGWDDAGNRARVEAFDRAEHGIDVDLRSVPGFFPPAMAMIGDEPPVLAEVSYAMVPALAQAGAIQQIGDCIEAAGVATARLLPAAASNGTVDGRVYGVPRSIDTTVLLYDRAAFRRAGLDPDDAPRTLDELRATGRALRDRAGIEHPIAWDAPQLALIGLDIHSDDAKAAADAWLALGRDDLLLPPGPDGPPPVGSGEAAIQWADPHQLWSYAGAISEGQAPDAELAVAPLPGVRGPTSTGVGGSVWVVSAKASRGQVAAAARFLEWYQRDEQQGVFHIGTDEYPTLARSADVPAVQTYWREHPLIGAGWDALVAQPTELRGWERVLGSFATIVPWMQEVAHGGADFETQWPRIVRTLDALEARQHSHPAELLRCLDAHIEDASTPVELCSKRS